MKITIDPEFRDMIPPPSEAERLSLEASIMATGCTTPLDVWQETNTLIDGHNRWEICTRLGMPFTVRRISFPNRHAVKAWIFENQIARRNLSPDQVVMLAAMRGIASTRGTARQRDMAATLAAAGMGSPVLAGKLSLALAFGAHGRATGLIPRKAYTPRGPSTKPAIPEGHELKGLSTLTGPDGEERGQWAKTQVAAAPEPEHPPVPEGHLIKKTSTMHSADGSVRVQWVQASADEQRREDAMRAAWARHAAVYAGVAGVSVAPAHTDADVITLYPLGDPHVGMLAWAPETGDHFDTKIACRELLACVRMLVAGAAASERAIICNLGDFMHAQDDAALTPGHGNKLDVDGRFAKVLDAGHTVLRGIVDAALEKHARVAVRNLPGNHDPRVAAELAMWLKAVYERDPRVTIEDAYAAHQYDRFGCNLFGWHHGDRSKASELPAIMATDRAADWGEATERVWHVGHVHHLTRHETPGCVVETHRTMAARDAWHAGRYRAGRSLQAIGYHKDFGETSRNTVGLARVRAALAARAP